MFKTDAQKKMNWYVHFYALLEIIGSDLYTVGLGLRLSLTFFVQYIQDKCNYSTSKYIRSK